MPCFHPIVGYRSKIERTVNGKAKIVFGDPDVLGPEVVNKFLPVKLPCGRCIGCRLERSRQWAIRCSHEASLHENNCFITLTYDEKHIPKDRTLLLSDLQKFMKRLRRRYGGKVRFYACGEYGDKHQRPHYHVLLFGVDFRDWKIWTNTHDESYAPRRPRTRDGFTVHMCKALDELWTDPDSKEPYGEATVGSLTFESAAYVARYITKKQTGKMAVHVYNVIDYETGEILEERRPEFNVMSRRPGIGGDWYEKYRDEVYSEDFVVMRGMKFKPPKFYDKRLELDMPDLMSMLKGKRERGMQEKRSDCTPARLEARELIQEQKSKLLKRGYENGS